MEKIKLIQSLACPLNYPNIDTDIIIPKQYLKSIKRTGYGIYAFDDWRYLDKGSLEIDNQTRRLNPDFILNQKPFNQAQILLAGANFGCGSSREHAVWALIEMGIKAIIAPSFGDIFFNNAWKNGLIAIKLSEKICQQWIKQANNKDKLLNLSINLENLSIENALETKKITYFEIDPFRQQKVLNGYDDIDEILKHQQTIKDFEKNHYQRFSWLDLNQT